MPPAVQPQASALWASSRGVGRVPLPACPVDLLAVACASCIRSSKGTVVACLKEHKARCMSCVAHAQDSIRSRKSAENRLVDSSVKELCTEVHGYKDVQRALKQGEGSQQPQTRQQCTKRQPPAVGLTAWAARRRCCHAGARHVPTPGLAPSPAPPAHLPPGCHTCCPCAPG